MVRRIRTAQCTSFILHWSHYLHVSVLFVFLQQFLKMSFNFSLCLSHPLFLFPASIRHSLCLAEMYVRVREVNGNDTGMVCFCPCACLCVSVKWQSNFNDFCDMAEGV